MGGCKTPGGMKCWSITRLGCGENEIALRRNGINSYCMQYERSACKSLHRKLCLEWNRMCKGQF